MNLNSITPTIKNKNHQITCTASALFILVMTILVYLLPEDIIERSSIVQSIINHTASIVPSMSRLAALSTFSQPAQVTYLIELICIPLIILLFTRYDGVNVEKTKYGYSHARAILAITILPMVIIFFLIHFPFDPNDNTKSGRLSRSIIESKLAFGIWSAILITGISASILATYKWLAALVRAIKYA
ncbi:hypothetical protein [Ectothiorhodospira shaposhnikovii]|uniref:hypothetical protein n=1 Tax=Ectothiorhodospira shaposhnikovii TaxID=1054 RepID=UPI001904C828|nr:hypothetical protein [Ectothiorhodospira shaposhnikovii]